MIYITIQSNKICINDENTQILSSNYRWIFHPKKNNILFFTDDNYTLCVVDYSTEKVLHCQMYEKVEYICVMADSNSLSVLGKNRKMSFYSIPYIIKQLSQSTSMITPILNLNTVYVNNRYVVSYRSIGDCSIYILDKKTRKISTPFQMKGAIIRGCQLTERNTQFVIYTNIECLCISINLDIIARSEIEIIGNLIVFKTVITGGFKVWLINMETGNAYDFSIGGNMIEFNHILTMDDSLFFRAWTNCADNVYVI